jgi:hypothetical protein
LNFSIWKMLVLVEVLAVPRRRHDPHVSSLPLRRERIGTHNLVAPHTIRLNREASKVTDRSTGCARLCASIASAIRDASRAQASRQSSE